MKTTEELPKITGLEKISWGQKQGKSPTNEVNTHLVLFCEQHMGIRNINLSLFLKGFRELSGYPQT